MQNMLEKINDLRCTMVSKAEKHDLNLQHPEVLQSSVELDQLILDFMFPTESK
jgi:hypothetical protein